MAFMTALAPLVIADSLGFCEFLWHKPAAVPGLECCGFLEAFYHQLLGISVMHRITCIST